MDDSTERAGWLALGSVWLIALSLFILFQCVSPLLPTLIVEFHLNHWMGGFLYTLPVLMVALFSYPLGVLSDRIGLKVAVGCGAIVAVLSSLTRSLVTSYEILALSTAVFGIGFAMCFTNLPRLVKSNFPTRLAGTATGVYATAIPLGAGLGIALTKPIMVMVGSWRGTLMIWSVAAIPAVVVWWAVMRRTQRQEDGGGAKGSLRQNRESVVPGAHFSSPLSGSVLTCGLLLLFLNLMFYSTIGWLPAYLVEEGWDGASAATVTSIISFVEIPAVFLIPLLSDRTGRRRLILILSFSLIAVGSASLAIEPGTSWLVAPVLGTTFGGVFALLLAMPVELVEQEGVARAAGAILSIGYMGALAGPLLSGYLRDLTGSFVVGFLVLAVAGLGSMVLSSTTPAGPSGHSTEPAPEKRRPRC